MKTAKISKILLLLLCCCVILSACGEPAAPESTDAEYRVTVVDGSGNPYTSGVIVRFMSGTEQIAMQPVDGSGVAAKTLVKGDYTVELMFTGDAEDYYYDPNGLTLSAEKTELTVILSQTLQAEGSTLFAPEGETVAYPVEVGSTFVSLTEGQRNYFLFAPAVAGTYRFTTSDANAQIGYYGAPHFVQSQNVAEDLSDNTFTISIKASMIGSGGGTSVYVLGVDAQGIKNCILTIERIGDPTWSIEDEPWTVYQPTAKLSAYTLSADAKIAEFDLTAASDAYNLVYNEADGFYHLDSADGALVLVRLGKESKYLPGFQTMLERSGVNKYFFAEDGSFVKKETYDQCLLEYFEYMDEESGVYPLTEDLKYIIQQRGDHAGWWDTNGSQYLFVDENGNRVPGINADIAWLFMCCYIAQ